MSAWGKDCWRLNGILARIGQGLRSGRAFARDEKGVAAIEFALILPVMLILFVGMVELTLRLSESRKTTLLAGMIGDLVSQNETGQISDDEVEDYYAAARYVLLPFDDSHVLVRVASFSLNEDDEIEMAWLINKGSLDEQKCPIMEVSDLPQEMQDVINGGTPIIVTRVCRQQKTMISDFLGMKLDESPVYIRDSFYRPRYVSDIVCTSCS